MANKTEIEVNHLGKTIANVAAEVGKDSYIGAAISGISGMENDLDGSTGVNLLNVKAAKETDDYTIRSGVGASASYNIFDNEATAAASAHIGVQAPYKDGKVLGDASAEYDLKDGAQANIHLGYTKHDPNERLHTWTVDGYTSLAASGELQGAIRGEAELGVYKNNDGNLTSVYGRVALGASTTYGPGASVEVGVQQDVNLPVVGNASLRAGVGHNTSGTNYNDTSSIGRVEGDLNTGSDNEGVYGKVGISFKF